MLTRLILFYQRWVSPALPPRCRFIPTCSSYAIEALETHGTVRGCGLAVKRICRCHPFNTGGYDPVPMSSTGICNPSENLPPHLDCDADSLNLTSTDNR